MPHPAPAPHGVLEDVAELCDGLADIALYQMRIWPDHRAEYTYVSAGIRSILGWSADELLADPSHFDRNLDAGDRLKLRADLARGGGPHTHTVCHRSADGSPRWIKVRFRGQLRAAEGYQLVTGVAEDVTEAALLDAATRVAGDNFRAFMNNALAVAWMKDSAGRYVFLSERFQTLFGSPMTEWSGRTDHELSVRERADEYRRNDAVVLKSDRPLETVETGPEVNGRPTRWWVLKFPFRGPDGERYVGGVGLDLTEREQMQEELRKAHDDLKASLDKVRRLESIVTMCAWTRRMRLGDRWVSVEEFLRDRLGVRVSHGISDEALKKLEEELRNNPWRQ